MNKKWAALALLFLLVVVAGVRIANRHRGRVRIGYPLMMASLPVFVAVDQDLFTKAGVNAQPVSFGSSNDMVNALIAGQVELLPAVSLVPLIHLEIQRPGKVRVFSHSRMRPQNSTYRIVVSGRSGLHSLNELEGRRVGVFPGTSATRLLTAFLHRHGVATDKISFVQLPPSAQVSGLESGAIDALFAYDPLPEIYPAGQYRALSNSVYAELSDGCPMGVSVVSRDFERSHPQTAANAVRAVQQAIDFMAANPERARALLPRFTRMTPDTAARVNVADITLSNTVDAVALQNFINLLYDIGEIPERIDAHRLIDPTR